MSFWGFAHFHMVSTFEQLKWGWSQLLYSWVGDRFWPLVISCISNDLPNLQESLKVCSWGCSEMMGPQSCIKPFFVYHADIAALGTCSFMCLGMMRRTFPRTKRAKAVGCLELSLGPNLNHWSLFVLYWWSWYAAMGLLSHWDGKDVPIWTMRQAAGGRIPFPHTLGFS